MSLAVSRRIGEAAPAMIFHRRQGSTLPRWRAVGVSRLLNWTVVATLLLSCSFSPHSYGQQFRFGLRRMSDRFELSKEIQVEDDEIGKVRPQLALAQQLIESRNWDEAIQTLRRISAEHGGRVIQIADRRYHSIRDWCHLQITGMPDEAIALYRDRVDAAAEKWFREGKANRDGELLRRVVETTFCSRYGDDALDALAQIALERGEFDKARSYWEQTSPLLRTETGQSVWIGLSGYDIEAHWHELETQFISREKPPTWLAYPDTDLDIASIRARLVLVSVLQGATSRARFELDLFQRLHGDASGRLAGHRAPFRLVLEKLISSVPTWASTPRQGVRVARSSISPDNSLAVGPVFLSEKPHWKDPQSLRHAGQRSSARGLAFYPLAHEGLLFVNNTKSVFAYRAADGKPAWSIGYTGRLPGEFHRILEEDVPFEKTGYRAFDSPHYSMSIHGDNLFARLGSRFIPSESSGESAPYASVLACLDVAREGSLQWRIPRDDQLHRFLRDGWAFEGSPVADGSNVYVGMRRGFPWSESYVACFDARSGDLRWRTKICEAQSVYETANNLVTLHEGTVYYNTNLGAVAAIDASSGIVHWAYRYQRVRGGKWSKPAQPFFRGLNPCVYHDGLVIAGPVDCDSIVAIDALTGKRVWQSVPIASRHLLGVGQGNLIATGRSVWWFNALTGKLEAEWPGSNNRNSPRGFARGVLAGDSIFWPTNDEIFVFDQKLGPRRTPVKRPGISLTRPDVGALVTEGNLSLNREGLLVATEDSMFLFPWLNARPGNRLKSEERNQTHSDAADR